MFETQCTGPRDAETAGCQIAYVGQFAKLT